MQKSASTICLHFHSLIEYSLLSSINIYSNIICIPKAFCNHVYGNIYSGMLSPSSDNLYNSKDHQQTHSNSHNTDSHNRYGKFIRMFYQIYDVFAVVYNFFFRVLYYNIPAHLQFRLCPCLQRIACILRLQPRLSVLFFHP